MGGLGSYLLVCVVLSFLQLHPSAEIARAHSVSTLGKLLLDFFRYYGQDSQNIYVIRFDFRILGHGHSSFMIFMYASVRFGSFRAPNGFLNAYPQLQMQWTGTLQEFRYGSMGISVLAGGCLFDREKRGFTTRTRSGQATLCLESPADPSPMAVDHLVSVEIHVGQCSIKASIHSQDFSPRHRHWSTGLQDWHHPCSFQSWIPRSFDPVSLQGSREQ